MKRKTFHMVSLGCAKNTVDSYSMAELLHRSGYRSTEVAAQAQVIIVNTCGFIGPAKEESLAVLSELAAQKRDGQTLIAAGCLTQRYGAEVARQVPGIDGILGTRRWMDIVDLVHSHPKSRYHLPDAPSVGTDEQGVARVAIQGASAYLKIADGCRRPCAFCAIPLIKGRAVSRPPQAILHEARMLQAQGVREIILIAQDTTDYGHDLGMKDGLAELLEALLPQIPEVDWVRLMYAYPGYVTERLIQVITSQPHIVPYLDMPLQHAHPAVLRRMRRPANIDWVRRTLERMRTDMPDLAIRTTFIVGYPGESEAEFQALLDFIQEMRFDRVGAFQFSFEPGTTSEALGDPIPAEVKQERYERLMALQQGISLELNQAFIGRTLQVLVEGNADDLALGRSYRDAPEIDGMVIIENAPPSTTNANSSIQPGEMLPVRITGAMAYDLSGVVAINPISGSLQISPEGNPMLVPVLSGLVPALSGKKRGRP